jgi:hypothetical protein
VPGDTAAGRLVHPEAEDLAAGEKSDERVPTLVRHGDQ